MNAFLKVIILISFLFSTGMTVAGDYLYILNENILNKMYNLALESLYGSEVIILKEPMGVLLRLEFDIKEFATIDRQYSSGLSRYYVSPRIFQNLTKIEYFLAKIKNPVIIEVHTDKNLVNNIKNWELSTVLANRIEAIIENSPNGINQSQIKSVGFGEFLPAKNTSYNGGKYSNRIDIMIICDISGE